MPDFTVYITETNVREAAVTVTADNEDAATWAAYDKAKEERLLRPVEELSGIEMRTKPAGKTIHA